MFPSPKNHANLGFHDQRSVSKRPVTQEGKYLKRKRCLSNSPSPAGPCCFVPVTEPTAALVWKCFDEFRFIDHPVTKVHFRFGYCLSEACPWDPWKMCDKECDEKIMVTRPLEMIHIVYIVL